VDKAENYGATPLDAASGIGRLEVVKYLVEEGKADVDKARDTGCTPLYVASSKGKLL